MKCPECEKGFLFQLLRLRSFKVGWYEHFKTKTATVCSNVFCDYEVDED